MQPSTQGSYSLSVKNNILIVNAEGPFDEETIQQYLLDSKAATEEIQHQPWAILTTFSGKGVLTPEAEQALINITKERKKNNLMAVTVVIKNNLQADLQQTQLARIYELCHVTANFFSNETTAYQWLNSFMSKQKAVS